MNIENPELAAALTLIAAFVVPLVTSLITNPQTPSGVKRWIPIGLSLVVGVVIAYFNGLFGTVSDQIVATVLQIAALLGFSQGVYAAMPGTWKSLSAQTSPHTTGGTQPDIVQDADNSGHFDPENPNDTNDLKRP
jgi:hypothetical protein